MRLDYEYEPGFDRDYDMMMTDATILYNRAKGSICRQDMARNRIQIAEAIVGEQRESLYDALKKKRPV